MLWHAGKIILKYIFIPKPLYLLALWVFQNKIIIFGLNGKYIAYKYSVQSKCDAQKEFIPAKEKSKMKTEKIVKVKR